MQRALATSLIGLTLGWGGLISLPGYKPYVSGKGYKPYQLLSPTSSTRRPIPVITCNDNGWLFPSLIRGNEPLTFCQVKVRANGTLGSEWLDI